MGTCGGAPSSFLRVAGRRGATAAVATISGAAELGPLPAAGSCACASFWCCLQSRGIEVTGFAAHLHSQNRLVPKASKSFPERLSEST